MSSEPGKNLRLGALALIPLACCIGLPLIAAAGISAALAAWVGGITVAALVLIAAAAALILRARRQRRGHPSFRVDRSGT